MKEIEKMIGEVVTHQHRIGELLRDNGGVYAEVQRAIGSAARARRRMDTSQAEAYRDYASVYERELSALSKELYHLTDGRVAGALSREVCAVNADYKALAESLSRLISRQMEALLSLARMLENGRKTLQKLIA